MLGSSRVVATVLASVLVVGPAWAQPTATPPTPAQKQSVQDLVKQAIAKSQAGDHSGAIEIYQKAYAVIPLPTLLSNIGAEYQLATKPVEALKYFCMYLEKDPAGPLATYATGQAKLLQSQLTNTTVDDAGVCKAPTKVEPKVIETPPPPPPVSKAADPGKTLKIAGLVAAGVGVVSVGLGFYFGSQAGKISDDISNNTGMWRDDIVAYQDEGQRDEYLQIAFLSVGGALVVGGALLYMKGRKKTSAESTTVQPAMMPGGGGGLSLSGAF